MNSTATVQNSNFFHQSQHMRAKDLKKKKKKTKKTQDQNVDAGNGESKCPHGLAKIQNLVKLQVL